MENGDATDPPIFRPHKYNAAKLFFLFFEVGTHASYAISKPADTRQKNLNRIR
jgi:hypothetical protein